MFPSSPFPNPRHIDRDLIAVGGQLTPEYLLSAYTHGIFPWFNPGDPILWWSPNPRGVFFPHRVHVSRSLRKAYRQGLWTFAFDQAFDEVMKSCADPRDVDGGTWITPSMVAAYTRLYHMGKAHSLEVYSDGVLVGGLYGVALGQVFFGESMFSKVPNVSKLALKVLGEQLCQWKFRVIDTQFLTPHLQSMGAEALPKSEFLDLVEGAVHEPSLAPAHWTIELNIPDVFKTDQTL